VEAKFQVSAQGLRSGRCAIALEKHQELKARTKKFALRVIKMSQALPRTREANVINSQILRSATSMAANYRAVGRARSKAEFVAKIGIVIEEADETVFWLEMLAESGIVKPAKPQELLNEANQLLSIFSASGGTART
jgi:four helix bundle protein